MVRRKSSSRSSKPITPLLTVDGVVLDIRGKVALIRRGNPPFKGRWALPGGFVDVGETIEKAVVREVREETGMGVRIASIVGVYSNPKRDPRGHTVGVAFLCRKTAGRMKAGDDAAGAAWFEMAEALDLPLAFDHRAILRDAVRVNLSLSRRKRRRGRPAKAKTKAHANGGRRRPRRVIRSS